MTRPSDNHWSLLTSAQRRKTRIILETLAEERIRFVLGGGWAVYAHAATTPSIDCDVFIEDAVPERVLTSLAKKGVATGPQRDLELLPLDEPLELLGTGEEDLGIPAVSYVPSALFQGRIETRPLQLDRRVENVPLPDRLALAVTKLCALQGRSLSYRSFTDGQARMRLGPVSAPQVLSLDRSYYLRKAGKDLFDASLLLPTPREIHAAQNLAGPAIWNAMREEAKVLPAAVQGLAVDLALRVNRPSPAELIPRLIS